MSLIYHSFDSSNLPVDELVAGAYAEHVGTLGGDEALSTLSRNWVENRVVTQRILDDENAYLTKAEATTTYSTKAYVQSLYPVGTIYMNDTATSVPFDFGTWDLVDGKFLYGCSSDFSDIGDTGGATSVTLSTSHFPTGNIGVAFPAISGTTGSTSTQHYHSGTTSLTDVNHYHILSTSGTTGEMSGNATGTVQGFTGLRFRGTAQPTGNCIADGSGQMNSGSGESGSGLKIDVSHTHSFYVYGQTTYADYTHQNQNHSHTFDTGNMSANDTHTHTFSIAAQTLNIQINSGTQDAFNILPPYKKVGIWRRSA